jgi:hypothetical protein
MANIFTNLAVPAGDGVGAGSDTSAMGRKRTITVQNAFLGIVTIEFSNEAIGGPYAQAITFYAPGKKTIDIAAQFMRVRRAAAGGAAPNVDVSSNDNGGQFVDLPAPAGDGVGAAVNVSAFGTFNTIAVLGTWEGVTTIEISEDNASWAQCATLQNPGYISAEFIAQFMRVRRAGTVVLGLPPGLPNVDVGAINDPISTAVASAGRWNVRGPFIAVQLAAEDDLMLCNPTAGGFPINLPAVTVANQGQQIAVKNITGSINAIAVTPNGADTIEGVAAAVNIATGFASLTLVSDGAAGWSII